MIKDQLAAGFSWPEAVTRAAERLGGKAISEFLRSPNNLLACEYLRAVSELRSPLKPVPVRRITTFNDAGDTDHPVLSASQIRSLLKEQGISAAEKHVPEETSKILRNSFQKISPSEAAERMNRHMFGFLRYRLMTADHSELREVYSVGEGIENRLLSAAADPEIRSVTKLAESVSTRRYTKARIMRMLTHILMNFRKEDFEWLRGASCARVLAYSERGRKLLARMRKTASVPVLSNLAGWHQYDARTRRIIELDIRAAGLYEILQGGSDQTGGEIRYVPYGR